MWLSFEFFSAVSSLIYFFNRVLPSSMSRLASFSLVNFFPSHNWKVLYQRPFGLPTDFLASPSTEPLIPKITLSSNQWVTYSYFKSAYLWWKILFNHLPCCFGESLGISFGFTKHLSNIIEPTMFLYASSSSWPQLTKSVEVCWLLSLC